MSDKQLPPEHLSHEEKMLQGFLDNQKREIELKAKEIELNSKNLDNDKDVALANISAQSDFLNKQIDANLIGQKALYKFWSIIAIVLLIVVCFTAYLGQYEIVEKIITLVIGGVSGYFIGHSKANKEKE